MAHQPIVAGATIGILGAGQLGKMSLVAAHQLGYHTAVYSPDGDIPAMEMATHRLVYPWDDPAGITHLLEICDVITTEWENVPLTLIKELESRGATVRPGSEALEVAQRRSAEKMMAFALDIPTTQNIALSAGQDMSLVDWSSLLPGILKTDVLGYDGKGQFPVATVGELIDAHQTIGVDCVLEKRVDLLCELSVLVARTIDGSISVSDVVENSHNNGILATTVYPGKSGDMALMRHVREEARQTARKVAMSLELEGLLCLEFFVDQKHRLLFNEMAPRPHNSFHGSIEAARTSQFEQHIRAICGLPLGDVMFHSPFKMTNLIGGTWDSWSSALHVPTERLHLYGKAESRPGRKMGHVTRLTR